LQCVSTSLFGSVFPLVGVLFACCGDHSPITATSVTRFARQRDNNNVGSSDLTRKFIGTILKKCTNIFSQVNRGSFRNYEELVNTLKRRYTRIWTRLASGVKKSLFSL
jgi:hypothetical protein